METIFYKTVMGIQAIGKWRDSNLALHRLVESYGSRLNAPISIALDIRRRMKPVFPLMDEAVRHCCHNCRHPCCVFNRVWFDFADLLLLNLLGERIPPAQLWPESDGDPCRYLSGSGCELPRILRPYACLVFICIAHREYLKRKNRAVGLHLYQELQNIRLLRMDMEENFNRAVSTGFHLEQ